CGIEKSDDRHCRLLRTRRERPCGRRAEQADELAAFPSSVSRVPTKDNIPRRRLLRCGISGASMSAMGQKLTLRHHLAMSALPPKADKEQTCRHVRFVPKADKSELTRIWTARGPQVWSTCAHLRSRKA